jgi:hypothetical protein
MKAEKWYQDLLKYHSVLGETEELEDMVLIAA